MKKFVLLFLILFVISPVFASGVGYINYEKVFANYKFAQNSAKEIQAKSKEIQDFLAKKESEFNKIESPLQKKKFEDATRVELKTKEDAFNAYSSKREEEVYSRIHAVSEKIRLEKKLDAIFDMRCVFSGGEDITDLLILKLNENQR